MTKSKKPAPLAPNSNDNRTYDQWLALVQAEIERIDGCPLSELPDGFAKEMWEHEDTSPSRFARKYCARNDEGLTFDQWLAIVQAETARLAKLQRADRAPPVYRPIWDAWNAGDSPEAFARAAARAGAGAATREPVKQISRAEDGSIVIDKGTLARILGPPRSANGRLLRRGKK
jgi:hypothetical protein